MKIKLTNERLLNDAPQLRELINRQLPIKASYAIAKNVAKIEAELKIYTGERAKLIEKYVEKEEDGKVKSDDEGQIIFKEGCKEQWEKDIKELLAIENEVEIHKFNLAELEGHSMKPSELMLIDYMIEE